jgi:ribosomal protein L11 methyltransferase
MNAAVFELSLPACVDVAELAGMLACPSFLGAWEADGSVVLYWSEETIEILQQVRSALTMLGVDVPACALHFQPVMVQDWNAKWAESVQPVRIGRRIGIRPSWATMVMPDDGITLIIDPKQAFGTGHHATTRLILEWLEEVSWVPGMRVLDVGTGSGILAMAALRLGATSALGIDVDATALDCAREYSRVNAFTEALELRCCRMETLSAQSFDVILANLDCRTLLHIYGEFSRMRHSQTQLMVSGLLEEDEAEIVSRLEGQGWIRRHVRRQDGWIAVQLEASSPGSSDSG